MSLGESETPVRSSIYSLPARDFRCLSPSLALREDVGSRRTMEQPFQKAVKLLDGQLPPRADTTNGQYVAGVPANQNLRPAALMESRLIGEF